MKTAIKSTVVLFLVLFLINFYVDAQIYIQFGNKVIEGDVTTKGYEKWVEALSVNFDMERDATTSTTRTSSVPAFSSISFTKEMGVSSVPIMRKATTGALISPVRIHFVKTGGEKKEPYLKITLDRVEITNYSLSSSSEGRPSESFSLIFGKVLYEYIPYDDQGRPSAAKSFKWDLIRGKEE